MSRESAIGRALGPQGAGATLTDAQILRLLISIYGDGVRAFKDAPKPPPLIREFLEKANRTELRGLFLDVAVRLHKASR